MPDKKMPICWKCVSKIMKPSTDNSMTLIGCKECDYIHSYADAERLCPLMKDPTVHVKITHGYVAQRFKEVNGQFICIEQSFVAGDPVEYENTDVEPIEIDTDKEVYQPFDMVQPTSLNPVKLAYNDGVCPDCDTGIPEDVVDGQSCENCDHVFCLPRDDDT